MQSDPGSGNVSNANNSGPRTGACEGRTGMGFSTAVKSCMRQFATFSGRARRAEFWMFYLFLNLVALLGFFVVMLVALAVFATNTTGQEPSGVAIAVYLVAVILWALGVVALWIPFLAVSARRLHDIGQSGHWLWLY